MILNGTVQPGFESLKALYANNMSKLAERNTQLCVYVGEERVVDLWASAIDDAAFSADSLVNVFSSGKSLEAITLAMLVDRGLVDYNARITEYWPEFAGGDSATTVADLMRHEAGLAAFDTTIEPKNLQLEEIRANAVGAIIERQTQMFREGPDTQREYHAMTRGWILNEVFRRVEPAGRTIGEFLRQEISTPLGIDAFIGLKENELQRISNVQLLGFGYQFAQGLLPRAFGRKTELNLGQSIAKLARLRSGIKNRTRGGAPVPVTGMGKLSVFDSPLVSTGEIPSAGAKCSARGLGRLAAVMANGGEFAGHRLLSETAYAALHAAGVPRNMMSMTTTFTQGGLATFPPAAATDGKMDTAVNRGREGFFGWMGLGGSIFQWHPEHKIGFAYVPTSLNVLDIVNERGKTYQAEAVRCVTGAAG